MNARPSPDVELRWTTTEPTALVPMNSVGHLISKENGECAPFRDKFGFWSLPPLGWAGRRRKPPTPTMAPISPSAGAPPVTWSTLIRSGPVPTLPPFFATIARKADFTPEKIALFLLDPHPKMPNFPLSRSEAADIAAYIGSLRK